MKKLKKKFKNIFEAGYELKLSPSMVGRICRGVVAPKNYILKYGEKELQAMEVQKPKYKNKPMNSKKNIEKIIDINYDDIYDVDL